VSELPTTEAVDSGTVDIDTLPGSKRVHLLIEAQLAAVDAAIDAEPSIVLAVEIVTKALREGGRVVVIGAGTSGRLAVIDAAELWPTFGFASDRYEGRIAGGDAALRTSVEGAEDDVAAGEAAAADLGPGDVALAVSASGSAPYVCAALRVARGRGVYTIALVNARKSELAAYADVTIEAITGAEPIAGSTRMRAGTAQKIVLNTISTAAMIGLGKTYRNRMVDVVASNAKLRARAERLVREFGGDTVDAPALLEAAGGNAKCAIVMARQSVDRDAAERLLAEAGGRLGAVIDVPPGAAART
jgi:N-acetylmuramic acid 6-phosphate etherase